MASRQRVHQKRRQQTTSRSDTTAIVRVAAPTERPWELNHDQVVLLKNYLKIADASDAELAGCLEVARRYRLDPFKQGQIWFVKRWDKNAVAGNGTKGAYVYTPQVGIYGMLHVAARDHKDYGSISDPEFGPMIMHEVENHKFKAPEWCRVKAFKKGIAEPTVATIYFEEFCPAVWDNARLFWAKMPRAQIEKCCKARVVRTAYPDMGGLYIPEEMDRINAEIGKDYTPGGRLITKDGVTPSGQPVSWEAKNRAQIGAGPTREMPQEGFFCARHQCPFSKCPADEHSQAELEAMDALERASKKPAAKPIDVTPTSKKPDPKQGASAKDVPKAAAPAGKVQTLEYKYELVIDWNMDRNQPVLTGHLEELGVALAKEKSPIKMIWGKEELWHAAAKDIPAIMQVAGQNGFAVREIHPGQVPPSGQRSNAPSPARKAGGEGGPSEKAGSTPSVISGVIERVNTGMAGKNPVKHVTLLLADKTKPTFSCFDKKWFEALDAGLGKQAHLITKQNGKYINIIGARKIGSKEWLEDGTPAIQRKDQEAGGKTLFG
jgi:hypothetical protein